MVAKIGREKDPLQQLFSLIKEGSALGDAFKQMMIIYVDIWRLSVSGKGTDAFVNRFRSFLLGSKKAVAGIIERAKTSGKIAKKIDSKALAGALIALIDGICIHHMILEKDFDADEVIETFFMHF